jgi:tetratricopeptide (TPR) repeat protein
MYLDVLEKRGSYAGIYWRKIDETIDISDVVGSFFTIIGKPIQEIGKYKTEDLLALFLRELHTAPYFLVLDNFEILIDPQANKPLKPGFSDLIEKANEITGRSRILFTSWESPASERGIRPECYPIGGLDETAAIQLLRRNGLTEPDTRLKEAVRLCGSHPLALILLAQLVREGVETLSGILTDNTLWLGEKGEVAERILDKVYKERLNEEEQKLLQYVSLYRAPVPLQAIVAVANASGWTEAVIKKTALGLSRKSLLQKAGENYWEESLIQNYAYNKLVDKVERHKRACEYYLSLPLPENPTKKEDVQPFIEAHHHACMAKEYDKAAKIIFDYKLNEDLEKWGNHRTLVDLCERILPKDHLKDDPILSDIQIHGHVLGSTGIAYSAMCEERKAIEYYEKALKIFQKIGDKQGESASLGNLGRAHIVLGKPKGAIVYYEKALRIAQEVGDKRSEGTRLGNIGNAYNNLGEYGMAIVYYERAKKIAHEIDDRRNEGVWLGNIANTYSILGEVRKAFECYEKTYDIALENGDKKSEGAWLGNLGNAHRNLGEERKAIGYYEKALKIAQEIGDKRSEGGFLGNIGIAYKSLSDVTKAIEYYKKALMIAQEIEDRHGEGAWLGGLGNAYCDLKEMGKTIECYARALKIASEIGDRGNKGVWLNNLGNVFRDQKKYKEALAFYLLAKDIFTQIEDPDLVTTESNLKALEEKLGKKEFEKLEAEVKPRTEEIVKKLLGDS